MSHNVSLNSFAAHISSMMELGVKTDFTPWIKSFDSEVQSAPWLMESDLLSGKDLSAKAICSTSTVREPSQNSLAIVNGPMGDMTADEVIKISVTTLNE